ncbi:unnamed protein product [Clonostachys solani]|uniref:Zn(2)-C6 fungal-type domain-containing protein n=1 Tax=Clonostachys solani TaxID=160281 RepID=A0A9N9WB46_9HYPO|nr:unnamed protein product [Clonostachys solani]
MNTRSSRQYRRVGIACDNCRRKKTRCPGQKPRCSTCARLDQRCLYDGNENDAEQPSNEDVISRLRLLEAQLNTLNDKFELGPAKDATPSSAAGPRTSLPGSACPATPVSTLQTSHVRKAFEVYFERIHRQPLWLFESSVSPPPDTSEELTYAILALSLSYSPREFNDPGLQSATYYYDQARRRIMLDIAEGNSDLQSIKVLCLLSFFNVISGNIPLAGLNMSFAQNLMQYATITSDSSDSVYSLDERPRIFWSLALLNRFYGPPILIPVLADGIKSSCFSTAESRNGKTACPPVPLENGGNLFGVWAHCARLGSLWGDVRVFISRCMEGSTEAPWNINSDYHALYSRSLDLEVTHRTELSYNNVRFAELSKEEVQRDRHDWLPWLRMQVAYHTILCMLNHPFLFSSKVSKQKFGKTTFWRESSEKALRHCNWVSRLLRLPREKQLQIDDPFFAQAAGIAATLNLYWARVNDSSVRTRALENLEICQTVIFEMATYLPVCATIEQSLNLFKNFVTPSPIQAERLGSTKAKPTMALKWLLLDIAAPQFPHYASESQCGTTEDGHDEIMLNSSDIGTPPARIRESTGHYASPPEWMSSQTDETPVSGPRSHLSVAQQEAFHQSFNRMMSDGQYDQTDFNLAWGPWGQVGNVGDSFGPGLEWWDFTTL